MAVLVGVPHKDAVFKTHPMNLLNERTLKGTFFGNYKPRSDLPSVVEKYMSKVQWVISTFNFQLSTFNSVKSNGFGDDKDYALINYLIDWFMSNECCCRSLKWKNSLPIQSHSPKSTRPLSTCLEEKVSDASSGWKSRVEFIAWTSLRCLLNWSINKLTVVLITYALMSCVRNDAL